MLIVIDVALWCRDDDSKGEEPAAKKPRLDPPTDPLAPGVGLPDLLKAEVTEVSPPPPPSARPPRLKFSAEILIGIVRLLFDDFLGI